MKRGRPFEPGNKFGQGRPKGSLNKKVKLAHKLFEDHTAGMMALAINRCREDPQMLRLLISRILPRPRGLPVKVSGAALKTTDDLNCASEETLKQAMAGKLSLTEAMEICSLIENRRRVLETHQLEQRLSALENGAQTSRMGKENK